MSSKRHGREQILAILREAAAGVDEKDLCRRHGVSAAALRRWRARHAHVDDAAEPHRLQALENENSRLKRLLAEAELDKLALKEILSRRG